MVGPSDVVNKTDLIPEIPNITDFDIPLLTGVQELFDILQGKTPGGIYQNPVSSGISDCQASVQALLSNPEHAENSVLLNTLNEVPPALNALQNHTDSTIANMNRTIGPVMSGLRVRQSVGQGLPSNNPCLAINDIFGTLLGAGLLLLGALAAALVSLIPEEILNAINNIFNLIAKEVAALNQLLKELQDFATASSIANLSLDPCAQAIFNTIGTPGMLGALSNMPKF